MLSTTLSGEMIELKIPAYLFACVYAEKRLLLIFFLTKMESYFLVLLRIHIQ